MARDKSLGAHHPFFIGVPFRLWKLAPDLSHKNNDREKENVSRK
jgi:hypothetical protein